MSAVNQYNNAYAIIVNYNSKGQAQTVYLGVINNQNRRLSVLGGGKKGSDPGPKMTVARVVEEQALKVFGTADKLRDNMGSHDPVYTQGKDVYYILPVVLNPKQINVSGNFKKLRPNNQTTMAGLVAIKVSDLRKKIASGMPLEFPDSDGIPRQVREATESALKAAVEKGKL